MAILIYVEESPVKVAYNVSRHYAFQEHATNAPIKTMHLMEKAVMGRSAALDPNAFLEYVQIEESVMSATCPGPSDNSSSS